MKEYASDQFDDFGFTIVDECHHIAAEVFSRSLPKINSYYSLGLSATPNRPDGLSKIFHMYLGPMIYKLATRMDSKVRINTIKFHDNNPEYRKEEMTAYGVMCVPRMVTNIVNNMNRNILINCIIEKLVLDGHKILVLSDRRDHLAVIHSMVEKYIDVGYYVGGMKQKDLDISAKKTVILGTYPMSSEGLNIPELNSAVFTTSKSSIEQSIGRIVRKAHEKMPVAFDIVDEFSIFPRQYLKREKVYKRLNYDIHELHVYANSNSSENTFKYALDQPYTNKALLKKKATRTTQKTLVVKKMDSSSSSDEADDDDEDEQEQCMIMSDGE